MPTNLSVLLVEDNRDSADALATYLRLCGHDIDVAFDGDKGTQALGGRHYDALLCDIGLPGRDGFQVAMAARRALGPEALLVAVTAYASDAVRAAAYEAGFNHFFAKPADPEALDRLLREHSQ